MKHKNIEKMILLLFSIFFITAGYVILFYTFVPLPGVDTKNVASKQSIIITDRNDEFLFDFSENEKRTFVPYEEIAENIINATIAIEDHLFFEHNGIRLDAFLRALINNIRTLSFSQGGSTITQQVIKNVFLTTEKNIERKMKEFLLAIKIEKKLTKEEIMVLYLNTISYGGVSYGIAEASNTFYGKKPSEITIAEAAYLAAVPKAPTFFSPYGANKKALENRKDLVLLSMLEYGLISREEYLNAKKEKVHFREQKNFSIQAPHFVFFVKEDLEKEHGTDLKTLEGKRIRTTLDIELQKEVEKMVEEFAPPLEKKHKAKNIATVVLKAKTGEILTMVGSRDFFNNDIDGSVNIITSPRQPGSTFKPIAYAEAFTKGLRPETVVYDVPTQFTKSCREDRYESTKDGCYSPVNYTGRFKGPISLRNALAQSINIPAVKVLYIANITDVLHLAKRMGIQSLQKNPYHYGLSLVLGGAEVAPLELAQVYALFSNEGVLIPHTWKYTEEEPSGKRIIKRTVAQDITDILSDDYARAPIFGANSALKSTNPPVAVKTGTTNNSRDIWIVGYSPDIVVLIWAGNSDGSLLENSAVGFSLAPLFQKIMKIASEKYGKPGAYFSINTTPPENGPDILSGKIDTEDLHTILYYIQKDRPTQRVRNPENDPQYKNWEYAVQDWLSKNEEYANMQHTSNNNIPRGFEIESPSIRRKLIRKDIVTIIPTKILEPNTRYEYYINGKLIGSSHLPLFSFTPEKIIGRNEEKITLQVIANTIYGTFTDEKTYTIKD